ncbi:MAG: RDD family protein [Candidatus Omnitrophica bacterium]|nr:RDD family protein [Candidatus Omnitrophota bacterium]
MEKRVLSSRTIRVFAGLVDYVFLYSLAGFFLFFILNKTLELPAGEIGMKILTLFPVISLVYCFKDSIYGISPGKYVVGIAVRTKDDFEKTPSLFLLFLRNISLIVWPLEILVLMFSKKKQRLGDLLAKTIVVRNHEVRLRYVLLRLFVIVIIITIAFAVSANVILQKFIT